MTYPSSGDILDGGGSAIVAGDLILINVSQDGSGGNPAITGFTRIFNDASSGANRGSTHVKIAAGTESGTFTYTPGANEQGVWRIAVIKDWHGTISGGVEAGGSATGTDANPNPGSFSPSWGAADNYYRAVSSNDGGTRTYSAFPSGYDLYQNSDASGGGITISRGTFRESSRERR